jgi:hypothetical protein
MNDYLSIANESAVNCFPVFLFLFKLIFGDGELMNIFVSTRSCDHLQKGNISDHTMKMSKLTLVEEPMKNTACLPPTPKYEMSLFKERGVEYGNEELGPSPLSFSSL